MATKVSKLPVEVELALEVMPCQAMRRAYDGAPQPHPCAHFAEWGVLHSYDYSEGGPPPIPGIIQNSVYTGKRPVIPEILSGCRKAPILAVGINPNLPGWTENTRNAIHPYFDDYLQYAHYFRWRALDKLRIPKEEYARLRDGREDNPYVATPLTRVRDVIKVEQSPVTMYRQYQRLLDDLAEKMGWAGHKLAVGEDLAYANMVACGGSRWTVQPVGDMPTMGMERSKGIIAECFDKRAYFPRQLLQTLPAAVIVFSQATANAFIARLGRHFTVGKPFVGEKLDVLVGREVRMSLGKTEAGEEIDTRVIFSPHASANPEDFERVRTQIVAQLENETLRGTLEFNPGTGHLRRRIGGCQFCSNALYSIGECDYKSEIRPLASDGFAPLADGDGASDADAAVLAERHAHTQLVNAFLNRADASSGLAVATADDTIETLDAAAPSAPKLVLKGTIATMKNGEVIDDGLLYLEKGEIVAIGRPGDPVPQGFASMVAIETDGVIFPGLADLHNHLAYNILSLWAPKRALENRAQWLRDSDYRSKVGLVMDVVAKRQDLLRALIRYVEVKLLMGGVTSGQGMKTKYGGRSLFRGIVRNFEQPDAPALPAIRHKITDIQPKKLAEVREPIESGAKYFIHLAEGTNAAARSQFGLLSDNGLVRENVVGIHSLGLTAQDLKALGDAGGSVVWSALSNSILYGRTLDVGALKASGARFSLGSDWTPSGSRNILAEMKIAWLTAQDQGDQLTAEELAKAVTVDAMETAGWGAKLGSISAGNYADLTIIARRPARDAFDALLHATEADVQLVVVAGHARYGDAALMAEATHNAKLEPIEVGGKAKALHLDHPASPIRSLTLAAASRMLAEALSDLPAAREAIAFEPLSDEEPIEIELELNEILGTEDEEFDLLADAVLPQSVELDGLTVVDDPGFWNKIDAIGHLPEFLKGADGLRQFYD